MVIEEVNCIQNHLEIEKTCRESAEALASKVRITVFLFHLISFFFKLAIVCISHVCFCIILWICEMVLK